MHLTLFLFLALNCAHPGNTTEQAICTHPDLKAKNDEIVLQTLALKSKLPAEIAALLVDTDTPFQRKLNDCSNQDDIPACVAAVLTERQSLLQRATANPEAMREALAQVRYIDIGFLWKYWPQLVGRKLSVFGCLSLDDGPTPHLHATLETDNQKSVPVLFKSMPQEMGDFLDDQKPCAHWGVEVRKQGNTPLLYADDVLDRPLP